MKSILFALLLFFFFSCRHYNDHNADLSQAVVTNEHLTDVNRKMVVSESKVIDEFISRHQFHMTMTGTGLRYEINSFGKGKEVPKLHDRVTISYREFLLNGKLIYHTDSINNSTFGLGEGMETNGIEEALLIMKEGDQARIIVPSHLAFGLTGDGNKIYPGTPLYYEVSLLKIDK